MIGGGLLAAAGLVLPSGLVGVESPLTHPLTAAAMVLLALGLPALYASERRWFGTLATAAFWLMAVGWVVATAALVGLALAAAGWIATTVTLAGTTYDAVETFLLFLDAWTLAMIGALAFGAVVLSTDGATAPRLGAWLLVLAMPLGFLLVPVFEVWYVTSEIGASWLGPLSVYGLAWIVLGYHLASGRTFRSPRGRGHGSTS